MKILVIEDNPLQVEELTSLLRGARHAVWHACNGVGGLAQLAAHEVDVILLDLMTPGMDGWAFLDELAKSKYASVPVVLTSGLTADTLMETAGRRGVVVLQKPFTLEQLEQTLATVAEGGKP